MKRGYTYIITLLSICAIYFGSLYVVSKTSNSTAPYLDSILKEKSETIEEEQEVILSEPQSCLIDTRPAIIDNSTKREKAVIVILVRNNELNPMRRTLREFEDRFNRKFNYPYVFLNDEPFSDEFKQSISALTNAEIEFGLVPSEMWSVPNHVNETLMNERLTDYASRNIMYGGSLSYRHMCRFNSGFFYRHPLLEKYDYYWRVEPGVHFYCDLDYDPFSFMKENGKEYGFTITLKEIPETIPTLWEHTLKFAHEKQLNTTLLRFFGSPEGGYNLCHYWSNFEIASLNLWRDPRYQDYFDYLDSTGNFFYERWGDAIVHSLAAGLFLNKSQVHFFEDIGYKHDNFAHFINFGFFDWKNYREQGYQWNFKSNGEQTLEDKIVHDSKFAFIYTEGSGCTRIGCVQISRSMSQAEQTRCFRWFPGRSKPRPNQPDQWFAMSFTEMHRCLQMSETMNDFFVLPFEYPTTHLPYSPQNTSSWLFGSLHYTTTCMNSTIFFMMMNCIHNLQN
ncbi:hypothetical protein G6F61_008820 [Rhizopus arrhizus]|nr:hypothetical protein G6F61_008820 [Rhizopus arrhizus]